MSVLIWFLFITTDFVVSGYLFTKGRIWGVSFVNQQVKATQHTEWHFSHFAEIRTPHHPN